MSLRSTPVSMSSTSMSTLDLRSDADASLASRAPVAPLALVPSESFESGGRIRVARGPGALCVSWSWRNWRQLVPLLCFVGVWDVMLTLALASGNLPVLFWFTHGLTGLAMSYSWVAHVVNRTSIEVRGGWIEVTKGPMPWRAGHTLRTEDVTRLYAAPSSTRVNGRRLVDVRATTRDGRDFALVGGLDGDDQARRLTSLLSSAVHEARSSHPPMPSFERSGESAP